MDKEKIKNLIKYLNKKGILDIVVDSDCDSIDIFYSKYGFRFKIRLNLYPNITYFTSEKLQYKKIGKFITHYRKGSYRRKGGDVRKFVGGENISKLKTKHTRVDLNSAVYKNILLIQSWLDPTFEVKKKDKEELNNYASELKFYFEDKYGDVKLSISGDEVKYITAEVTNCEGTKECHVMIYKDGNYFLQSISTYWGWKKEKKVYKQREKIKK